MLLDLMYRVAVSNGENKVIIRSYLLKSYPNPSEVRMGRLQIMILGNN